MIATHRISALLLLSLCAPPAAAEEDEAARETLRVQATLVELPRTPPCESRRIVRVVTRYRVEQVLRGRLDGGTRSILVVQRCPEYARGPLRYGHGKAGPLRPGHSHLLRLEPLSDASGVEDRFPRHEPRWSALRTDPAPEPPRIVVVVAGGAGALQRLGFDAERVSVGRAPDSDVLLDHPDVAPRQLELEARVSTVRKKTVGEVVVRDRSGRGLSVNGTRSPRARAITAQDSIALGPYVLRVSLFLPEELGPSPEQ
jgi:hypothetical protein